MDTSSNKDNNNSNTQREVKENKVEVEEENKVQSLANKATLQKELADKSAQSTQIASIDNTIKYGDQVVFYESINSIKLQTIIQNGSFQNRFGYFGHSEVVGQQFGSKLFNSKRNAFIYLLRPDPVLMTDTLSHKTQILYQADISYVISKMNIQPGSIVVESGTGSASLSSSIARTLQDEGHLFTFEFNEARAKNGAEVLTAQGLKNFDVVWRDVITNGFLPIAGEQVYSLTEGMVDAVFLDLPRPFEAIGHAKLVLKRGGRLCCFSPCIEQVMKNCEVMRNEKFIQIQTVEIIQRPFERRERSFQSAFTIVNPDDINAKRNRSQLEPSADAQEDKQPQNDHNDNEDNNNDNEDNDNEEDIEEEEEGGDDDDDLNQDDHQEQNTNDRNKNKNKKGNQKNNNKKKQDNQQNSNKPYIPKQIRPSITKVLYSSGPKEIKGHTGYLSFAILM